VAPNVRGLVVADVDGTLVSRGASVSPAAQRAILAIVETGALVILATGRPFPAAAAIAHQISTSVNIVASNGNYIWSGDSPGTIVERFSILQVAASIRVAEANAAHATCFAEDGMNYAATCDEALEAVLRRYGEPRVVVVEKDELSRRAPEFVHIHLIRPEGWVGTPIVDGLTVAASEPAYMTLTPAGVTKATGVMALLSKERPVAPVFVVGDGENDLPLFDLPGATRIAVASGARQLRDRADFVVPSVEDDGFSWAVANVIMPVLVKGSLP
jgi:5-amino-6-(5-phospho-D-ribitylamino)uracil phosphatase